MKLLVCTLAVLFVGSSASFHFGRFEAENKCGTDLPECEADELCMTTPFGTRCFPEAKKICETDSDCSDSRTGVCFKANGADRGICEGCAEDADCASSNAGTTCAKFPRSLYGRCVACNADSQCTADEYCDAPQFSGEGRPGGFGPRRGGRGGRGGGGRSRRVRRGWGGFGGKQSKPTFSCQSKRATGEECRRDAECASGLTCQGDRRDRTCQ